MVGTCAYIGQRSFTFEAHLKKILQYATLWKAVVLLDEADVFLEARGQGGQTGDAQRHALVAVFLKELEYFSGMVFLTTNRLKTFDLAMKSRVHLALGYTSPDVETRRTIWKQYLQQVPAEETDIIDFDHAADCIVQQPVNGREISGVVNTARTIARHEKKKLQVHHIEKILAGRAAFDQVLEATEKQS
jgi:SpoVK/Ycf46/Vps4 family AAA+-type ATPase